MTENWAQLNFLSIFIDMRKQFRLKWVFSRAGIIPAIIWRVRKLLAARISDIWNHNILPRNSRWKIRFTALRRRIKMFSLEGKAGKSSKEDAHSVRENHDPSVFWFFIRDVLSLLSSRLHSTNTHSLSCPFVPLIPPFSKPSWKKIISFFFFFLKCLSDSLEILGTKYKSEHQKGLTKRK